MTYQIALVLGLTFLINLITTLSYSVRIVGIRTGRIAVSFALFNILVLVSRTANGFQAPLLASTIEKNINSGQGANLLDFRLIILSCTISTIIGGLLIPTFQRLLSIAVEKFSIYKSVPKVLFYGLIVLLQTGKTTDKHIKEAVDLYASRIKKYSAFEIITLTDLKNSKNMSVQEQKMKEGKRIIQSITIDDFIILLDERGKELRTVEFSGWIEKIFMLPKKRIVFVIGGPWGFSEEVYGRADFSMSLSRMTFPHQLVRLLFLEQLYRVFTIIKGEPYHHE